MHFFANNKHCGVSLPNYCRGSWIKNVSPIIIKIRLNVEVINRKIFETDVMLFDILSFDWAST